MKHVNEMTAGELIEFRKTFLPEGDDDETVYFLDAALDKLKEAITPNPDEIRIVWSVEDVYEISRQKNLGGEPTVEQAREVLRRVKSSHDAEIGVTWLTLEYVTYDVLTGR